MNKNRLKIVLELEESQVVLLTKSTEVLAKLTRGEEQDSAEHLKNYITQQIKNSRNELEENRKYIERGYSDREAYLISLSEEYEVPLAEVYEWARSLGPSEDFDRLVQELQRHDND